MIGFVIIVCVLTLFKMAYNGIVSLALGCGRRFTKGRKCALTRCPNSSDCPFSKYYKDPNYKKTVIDVEECEAD